MRYTLTDEDRRALQPNVDATDLHRQAMDRITCIILKLEAGEQHLLQPGDYNRIATYVALGHPVPPVVHAWMATYRYRGTP